MPEVNECLSECGEGLWFSSHESRLNLVALDTQNIKKWMEREGRRRWGTKQIKWEITEPVFPMRHNL